MPAVSYDGRSFLIDGKRVWLVSRTFEYFRYKPAQWPGLLKSLKASGFTCVCLPVPWALVEPSPNKFNFQNELDIQKVVRLAGEAGLFCILSPGPANMPDAEFAGMPAWLLGLPGIKLRQVNPAFTSGVSRYLSALWEQVRDQQATSDTGPGASSKNGPIILVRLEADWTGHQPADEPDYLREVARFHREDGCRVPLVLSNHLWHQVDTVISAWSARKDSLSMGRQLGAVQPEAPRVFMDLEADEGIDQGGPGKRVTPGHLAQALAGGVQVNLADAPQGLDPETRALLRFAGSFGFLFANLEPAKTVPVVHPSMADTQPGGYSLVGQSGSQGDVLFLFGGASGKTSGKRTGVPIMLANGRDPVLIPGLHGVAWAVLDARLPGFGQGISTTMSPMLWHLNKMLVVRAQTAGEVNVAGSEVSIAEATDKAPTVEVEQGLVIVGLNDHQSQRFWPVADGLVVGPERLDAEGNPDLSTAGKFAVHIGLDGKVKPLKAAKPAAEAKAAEIGAWKTACAMEPVLGADAFAKASGERAVEAVSPRAGAAWHEIRFAKAMKEQKLIAPEWGDDVSIYTPEGKLLGKIGVGTGPSVKLALPERVLIFSRRQREDLLTGWPYARASGVVGGLYVEGASSRPVVTQTGVPKLELWKLQGFVPHVHKLSISRLHAYKMQFKTNAARVCLEWPVFEMAALVLVNGVYAGSISPMGGTAGSRLVLQETVGLKKGVNEVVAVNLVPAPTPQEVVAKKNAPTVTDLGVDVLTGAGVKGLPALLPADEAFGEGKKAKAKPVPTWFKCAVKAGVPSGPVTLSIPDAAMREVVFNGTPVRAGVEEGILFNLNPAMFREDGVQELAVLAADGKPPAKVKFG